MDSTGKMKAYTIIAIILTAAGIALAAVNILWGAIPCGIAAIFLMLLNLKYFRRSKANLITVMKAVENNDHTFYLKEGNIINGNNEYNSTLNQIKRLIRATQDEVRAHEIFLAKIIEQVPTGIIITVSGGTVRFINHAALSYLSLPILSHLHRIRQVYPELYSAIKEMKNNESRSISIQTEKAISQLVIKTTFSTLRSDAVQIITINDINTELERQETDSWIALIRVMTHEIMNSVAPIHSISEMLMLNQKENKENTEADTMSIEAIRTIRDTSENLIRFVDDYRKFSSVPQPQLSQIRLIPVINHTIRLFDKILSSNSITLTTELSESTNEIMADKNLLMQVLQNLIKNAIEATPKGGTITITTGMNDRQRPFISIFNSGTPIPEDIRPMIFIPFFTTKEGGNGIGLSLSRYIMRLHGGNLRYSARQDGSAFVLEF